MRLEQRMADSDSEVKTDIDELSDETSESGTGTGTRKKVIREKVNKAKDSDIEEADDEPDEMCSEEESFLASDESDAESKGLNEKDEDDYQRALAVGDVVHDEGTNQERTVVGGEPQETGVNDDSYLQNNFQRLNIGVVRSGGRDRSGSEISDRANETESEVTEEETISDRECDNPHGLDAARRALNAAVVGVSVLCEDNDDSDSEDERPKVRVKQSANTFLLVPPDADDGGSTDVEDFDMSGDEETMNSARRRSSAKPADELVTFKEVVSEISFDEAN